MDKENLYYIVDKGTNNRITTRFKEAWIGTKEASEAAVTEIETWWSSKSQKYEVISIKDYENKFVEDDSKVE